MAVGFTNKDGDFVPTEKSYPVLHSSMLFPNQKKQMNEQKKNHLYDFARKVVFNTGKGYGKINALNDERTRNKQERIEGINEAVSVITEDTEMSNNEKISRLQRILSTGYRDMDSALLSRIKLELNSLNKANEKQRSQKKSKPKEQDKSVTFATDVDEEIKEPDMSYKSDNKEDEYEKPLSTQDLAVLSSIQSQIGE